MSDVQCHVDVMLIIHVSIAKQSYLECLQVFANVCEVLVSATSIDYQVDLMRADLWWTCARRKEFEGTCSTTERNSIGSQQLGPVIRSCQL